MHRCLTGLLTKDLVSLYMQDANSFLNENIGLLVCHVTVFQIKLLLVSWKDFSFQECQRFPVNRFMLCYSLISYELSCFFICPETRSYSHGTDQIVSWSEKPHSLHICNNFLEDPPAACSLISGLALLPALCPSIHDSLWPFTEDWTPCGCYARLLTCISSFATRHLKSKYESWLCRPLGLSLPQLFSSLL